MMTEHSILVQKIPTSLFNPGYVLLIKATTFTVADDEQIVYFGSLLSSV